MRSLIISIVLFLLLFALVSDVQAARLRPGKPFATLTCEMNTGLDTWEQYEVLIQEPFPPHLRPTWGRAFCNDTRYYFWVQLEEGHSLNLMYWYIGNGLPWPPDYDRPRTPFDDVCDNICADVGGRVYLPPSTDTCLCWNDKYITDRGYVPETP